MPITEKTFTILSPRDLQSFVNSYSPVWLGGIGMRDELMFVTSIDDVTVSFKALITSKTEELEFKLETYGTDWFTYQYIEEKEMNNE